MGKHGKHSAKAVESFTLDVHGYNLFQAKSTLVKIESFLYDTQQKTKKLDGVFLSTHFERTES